jgi:hypothetical protein
MPADLDAIQARADAATEGPWAWEATGEKDNSWAVGLIQDDDGEPIEGENEPGENIVIEGICEGIDAHIPDAEFIAHARADVPALVAELHAARAFEHFIREHATTSHIRALTLVENWDRLVAAGDAYPGSEEASDG